jgi:hypothetical protein
MKQKYTAVYVGTKNDTNGNPRRGWAIYSAITGVLHTFVDEGYNGRAALAEAGFANLEANATGRIDITPGQYRSFVKFAKSRAAAMAATITPQRSTKR